MALSDFTFINASSVTSLSNISTGMQSNSIARAADVNAIFRQNSMITVGLLNVIGGTYSITPETGLLNTFQTELNTNLTNYVKGITVTNATSSTYSTIATHLGSTTVGSTIKPVYLNNGAATECAQYAGATSITLNGISRAGIATSLYAPTTAGTSGQVLKSNGTGNDPDWISLGTQVTYSIDSTTGVLTITTI